MGVAKGSLQFPLEEASPINSSAGSFEQGREVDAGAVKQHPV